MRWAELVTLVVFQLTIWLNTMDQLQKIYTHCRKMAVVGALRHPQTLFLPAGGLTCWQIPPRCYQKGGFISGYKRVYFRLERRLAEILAKSWRGHPNCVWAHHLPHGRGRSGARTILHSTRGILVTRVNPCVDVPQGDRSIDIDQRILLGLGILFVAMIHSSRCRSIYVSEAPNRLFSCTYDKTWLYVPRLGKFLLVDFPISPTDTKTLGRCLNSYQKRILAVRQESRMYWPITLGFLVRMSQEGTRTTQTLYFSKL